MAIWALFSVANNYDQPENNLECFWHERPSLEVLARALGTSFPAPTDEYTLRIVKLWSGEEVQVESHNGTRYRLCVVEAGVQKERF